MGPSAYYSKLDNREAASLLPTTKYITIWVPSYYKKHLFSPYKQSEA